MSKPHKTGPQLLYKTMKKSKTITISEEEYEELIDDAEFLRALRMAGVDNWPGYDDAIDIYQSAKGE